MFDPITPSTNTNGQVDFTFNGKNMSAASGTTIAAALLAADQIWFRETPISGQQRGPFCMMGACYDCLVQIDGVSVQACMTPVTEGLQVNRVPFSLPKEGKRS